MLPVPSRTPAPQASLSEPLPLDPALGEGGAGEAPPNPALASAPTPVALLRAFRRRWLLATSMGLLCATAAAVTAWYVMPLGKHTAHSLLQVSANQPQIIFATADGRADFVSYRRTQMALIKSRWVLNTALRQPAVAALSLVQEHLDPVQWLEAHLKVDNTLGPELVRISLIGDDPDELKVLVQAVTKAYMDEIVNEEQKTRLNRTEHLKELYTKLEERLRDKRKALKALADAIGTNNSANAVIKQRIALEQLAIAQKDLAQLRSDQTRVQVQIAARLAREKAMPQASIPESLLEEQIQNDALVKNHVAQVAQLEATIEEIRQVATRARFPTVSQDARDKLRTARKALEARRHHLRPVLIKQLRDKLRRDSQADAVRLQDQLAYLKKLGDRLKEDVDRLGKESQSLNKQSSDLEAIRDEIAQDETLMKKVGAEVATVEVERDAPCRIRVREDGIVSSPFSHKWKVMAAGGAGGGTLALILFGITWWEFRSRRIDSLDEVVNKLGLRLVGALPHLPQHIRQRTDNSGTPQEQRWHSLLTESVDATRTMLLHAARAQGLRLVMITSAMGGEGKTSLATQLAVSLARSRRRTLLVDCDLRNPSAHRLFDVPRMPGFCEVLRDEAPLAEVIQPTGVPGLSLLPAGLGDDAALQELCQDHCGHLFSELKELYDFVVVDSSPVLPVVDSLLIGQHMDAVLFSVLHEVSQLPKVYAAYQRLDMLGIHILGAVVTGAPGCEVYGSHYQHLTPVTS